MSAVSGCLCEDKWSQRKRGGGVRATELDVALSGDV